MYVVFYPVRKLSVLVVDSVVAPIEGYGSSKTNHRHLIEIGIPQVTITVLLDRNFRPYACTGHRVDRYPHL